MRRLFRSSVLALAVLGGWFLWREIESRRLASRILGRPDPVVTASRTAAALKLTREELQRIDHPDLYALFSRDDLTRLVEAALREHQNQEPGRITLSQVGVILGSGSMVVSTHFSARLDTPKAEAKGRVTVTVAPAFDGSRLSLLPLAADAELDRLSAAGRPDLPVLRDALRELLKPVASLVAANVGRVEVPVQLAFARAVDFAALLQGIPGVESASGPQVPVRLAIDHLAALPTGEGLEVVASGRFVSPEEYEAAVASLADLRDQVVAARARPCERCGFELTSLGEGLRCLERSLTCRAATAFGDAGGAHRWLDSVHLLALAEAEESPDPARRQLHADLDDLLAVRTGNDGPTDWNAEGVAALFQSVALEMADRRRAVDAGLEGLDRRSLVAVRRSVLGGALQEILAPVTVSARLSVPDSSERIDQTINTGPAPDLNCQGNARACPSVFEYDGWRPRGCSSDCGTRNCHDTPFGEICVNGLDLDCQRRKTKCELTKERERLEYEARKAAAKARWTAEKVACETLKTAELAGCEINQRWLVATQSSNLGRIEGEARLSRTRGEISQLHGEVAPDLSKVGLRARVAGGTHAEASFVFTPLDAGHIACVAQWGDTVSADVELVPMEIALEAVLDEAATRAEGQLVYRYPETSVRLRMDPPPGVALLTQAPSMLLACPVPASLFGAALGAAGPAGLKIAVELALADTIEAKVPAGEVRIPLGGRALASMAGRRLEAEVRPQTVVIRWRDDD